MDREFLMTEETEVVRHKYQECPEIQCEIGSKKVDVLIDTGSQVTCVNEGFFKENFKGNRWPTLPVNNCQVYGALGRKCQKIVQQTCIPIKINNRTTDIITLVVPKLIHNFIIGVDMLYEWRAVINFQDNQLHLEIDNNIEIVNIKNLHQSEQ